MSLQVGIDATAWTNRRGDGRFVRNAVGRLVALHPEVEWSLYVDSPDVDGYELPRGAEVRAIRQSRPATAAFAGGSGRRPADLARLTLAVGRDQLDVFLSPSVVNYFPVIGIPSVVGIHDATATTHSRLILPTRRDRALFRAKRTLAVRRATRLFTISESSRAAIARHVGISPERMAVVHAAPEPAFAPQPMDAVRPALREHGLSAGEGYLLFAAGISPHKGLETLIEAYALLGERRERVPPLVVAGARDGEYVSAAPAVTGLVAARGLEDRVRFAGFVGDRMLACMYSAATAAVVPSESEGFGLAAVEAASCGTPVVLSDIGPHRETLGDAALFFRPGDPGELAERLLWLLDRPDERRARGERARTAAARLSWDDTARRLRALLDAAVADETG